MKDIISEHSCGKVMTGGKRSGLGAVHPALRGTGCVSQKQTWVPPFQPAHPLTLYWMAFYSCRNNNVDIHLQLELTSTIIFVLQTGLISHSLLHNDKKTPHYHCGAVNINLLQQKTKQIQMLSNNCV